MLLLLQCRRWRLPLLVPLPALPIFLPPALLLLVTRFSLFGILGLLRHAPS